MNALTPTFGRRPTPGIVPLRPNAPKPEPLPQHPAASSAPEEAIIELRNVCLGRLDPAAVAAMPEDRLTADVERLIS